MTGGRGEGRRRVEAARNFARRHACVASFVACVGCTTEAPIELVPIEGCGLDQVFSGLRVRLAGDFPPSTGSDLFLAPNERGQLEGLRGDANAIVVEGVFGTTVTAVGRSHGIDPGLARGRVPGRDADADSLPVWFAAPDVACAVAPTLVGPEAAVAVELASARVLVLGGRSPEGPSSSVIELDLLADRVRTLAGDESLARVGHAAFVRADDRVVVLGGARAGALVPEVVLASLAGDRVDVETSPSTLARASMATARHGQRALLVGGCTMVDDEAACIGGASDAAAWLDLDMLTLEPLPPLEQARFAAHAQVSVDGVAYVVGGRSDDGPVLTLERLRPGAASWETLASFDAEALVGLTSLDGGMVIAADQDGDLHWWSPLGQAVFDTSLRAPMLDPTDEPRPLLTLPGERVLVDTWLFAPGSAAADPSREIVDLVASSFADAGPRRTGAQLLGLRDGSVLLVGGVALEPGSLAWLARVRPHLDGPDEWVPDLATPEPEAFVVNTPGAATVVVGGLRLTGSADVDALPQVRAHVRGFRSRSFRLEFELAGDEPGSAHLLVGQGDEAVVALELEPADGGPVRVRWQAAGGEPIELGCSVDTFMLAQGGTLELAGDGLELRLLQGDRIVVDCELGSQLGWPDQGGLYVGFGASGAGERTFRALRLARR